MKKITLLLLAVAFSFTTNAQTILSQNTDEVFVPGGVSCGGGDNQWYREYVLPDEGVTFANIVILGAEFGIEAIDGPETLTINVYEGAGGFPAGFPGSLTLLDTVDVTVDVGNIGSKVSVDFPNAIEIAGTSTLVVEIVQPTASGNNLFLGATAEETKVSWIASTQCSVTVPVTMDDVGFPDAHHLINLVIDEVLSVGDNLAEVSSIYPNPMTNELNVKVPSNVEITNATLFDILGKDTGVKTVNGTMNTSSLTAGIYMLKVETSAGTFTQKVIKQ